MKRLEAVHVLTDRFLFPLSLKKKKNGEKQHILHKLL